MPPQVGMMPVPQPQAQPVDKVAKLKELKELLDTGVLSQEEFDAEKKKVLEVPATEIQPVMAHPGMSNMLQPGMMRPPPPGCPTGGEYVRVRYSGPATQNAKGIRCILGFVIPPLAPCCWLGACLMDSLAPKDIKEVYQLGGTYYTMNGTVDPDKTIKAARTGRGR